MEKQHTFIPQLDRLVDIKPSEERSSQTENIKVKNAEVQSESCESSVTVKWGESDQILLPPGTVILRYKSKSILGEVDYPLQLHGSFIQNGGLVNMTMKKIKNTCTTSSKKMKFILDGRSF